MTPQARMPLKAIAFDLWETLITNTPEISRAQKRLRESQMESALGSRGHSMQAAQIERAFHRQWDRCHELYWSEDIDVPCRRQIEIFLEELGVDGSVLGESALDELERVYASAAVEHPPALVAGAKQALEELDRRGYRVGLISNTGRTPGYALREILSRLELAPHIDAMVFSNEHGACKPRPSIFEELRASLGVEYREMLFIGDNLHVDVMGAKRCGMRAIHFDPPVRGTAVAPPVEHEAVEPDARISDLGELLAVIERLGS